MSDETPITQIGRSSPTIGKLALALAKAQATIEPAKKNHENPFFKSKYADLSGIWDSLRKALTDNELSVIQTTRLREHSLSLVTILAHSSGEYICGEYPINPIKMDPQGIGSAITYARRYALSAIVGASTEDDDDGNAASHTNGAEPHQHAPQQQYQQPIQQQYQQPAAPQQQARKEYPPVDPSRYQWRLHLPFKVAGPDGQDMGPQYRALVKTQKDVRFQKEMGEDGKETGYWYCNGDIPPMLQSYHRPLQPQLQASQQMDAYIDDIIPF